MTGKVIAGFLWTLVLALLTAFLFRLIPFDTIGKFVFLILFLIAFVAIVQVAPKNVKRLAMPVDADNIRVSIAGQIYKGKSLTVLALAGGGLFVNVDLSDPEDKEDQTDDDRPIKTTKKPQKVSRA